MLCTYTAPTAQLSARRSLNIGARHRHSVTLGQNLSAHRYHGLHRASRLTAAFAAADLPKVDWTRYHLQVLFVDRSDKLSNACCNCFDIIGLKQSADCRTWCYTELTQSGRVCQPDYLSALLSGMVMAGLCTLGLAASVPQRRSQLTSQQLCLCSVKLAS